MSDILKSLASPPVLVAGAVLGVVVLLASSKTPTSRSTPQVWSVGTSMNAAGAAYLTTQANNAAELGKAQFQADTSRQAALLSLIGNLDQHATTLAVQMDQSRQGIVKSQIASNTAMHLDVSQNFARLNQAWIGLQGTKVQAAVTMHGQDTALAGIKAQASAAKSSSMWNGISNIVGNVAKAAIAFA